VVKHDIKWQVHHFIFLPVEFFYNHNPYRFKLFSYLIPPAILMSPNRSYQSPFNLLLPLFLKQNCWGLVVQIFYRPEILPITQSTVSKNREVHTALTPAKGLPSWCLYLLLPPGTLSYSAICSVLTAKQPNAIQQKKCSVTLHASQNLPAYSSATSNLTSPCLYTSFAIQVMEERTYSSRSSDPSFGCDTQLVFQFTGL